MSEVSRVDRIRTSHDVHAMVAVDTLDVVAERVERLVSHGRRMSVAHRFATWTGRPPDLYVGLTLDKVERWESEHGAGVIVRTTGGPLLDGDFGVAAYRNENPTEAEAWARFHAGKAEADSFFDRRRDMTEVRIVGGLPGGGWGRGDLLVIRSWNRDGVCAEKVIGFDSGLKIEQEDAVADAEFQARYRTEDES